MSTAAAIERFTNLRRRLGLLGAVADDRWQSYLDGATSETCHEDLLQRTLTFYEQRPASAPSPFGCFTYDPPDAQGTLRLHFMPEARHRLDSPLGDDRLAERQSELCSLIDDVRQRYPNVRRVRGLSWLYNLRQYQRLFPREYVESIAPPTSDVNMSGSSTWGQVLNHRHEVRTDVRDHVLAHADASTLAQPWLAFPLRALSASSSIDCF